MNQPAPAVSPVHCPEPACPWAVFGIPDAYTDARARRLAEHQAEEHAPVGQPDAESTQPPEPYTYTDPTDAFGHTLSVTPVDASTYDGSIPVVSLAIQVPADATDPENPVVYVPIADVDQVVIAIRAAARRNQSTAELLRIAVQEAEAAASLATVLGIVADWLANEPNDSNRLVWQLQEAGYLTDEELPV